MNFLEAHRIASGFQGGAPLDFLFGISGATDKLGVFLKAAAAQRGRSANVRSLPFNTLPQATLNGATSGDREVFVLFPWDFVPEADWRSGVAPTSVDLSTVEQRAREFAGQMARRRAAGLIYVAAPVPPLFANPATTANLQVWVATLARELGAGLLPPEFFSLSSYLSTGNPFASSCLGEVAERVINLVLGPVTEPAKVLVTDLDNVLWNGIIGEDGLAGIRYTPDGVGFRHYLYQTLLLKLKREGTLLSAVSRNDHELAAAPLRSGLMALREEDFVTIVASYNAKSAQIGEIAKQLNLGLDSFVFVDDNALELEEVSRAVPGVRTLEFPRKDDDIPLFFQRLSEMFARPVVTSEDADRTEMYRRRLDGMIPATAAGADLTDFLRSLEMSMIVRDRSNGDCARAIQLINKTNQFNLNGRRFSEEEVASTLATGGKLYGVTLNDRTGSHGEVLACLIDANGSVQSFVMSCRVFQRRLEYAFLSWLSNSESPPKVFDFVGTARNEPMRSFLSDPAFTPTGDRGTVSLDGTQFRKMHLDDLAMFTIVPPVSAPGGGGG